MHTHTLFRKQFQETRRVPTAGLWLAVGSPGLKTQNSLFAHISWMAGKIFWYCMDRPLSRWESLDTANLVLFDQRS